MSEMLDVYAAETEARKYRDMVATDFLTSQGYKWERYEWVAPDGLTPRQLAEQRAELLEVLQECVEALGGDDCFELDQDTVAKARAAIANATQQRNATGGEG